MKTTYVHSFIMATLFFAGSCVSPKLYSEAENARNKCQQEREQLLAENEKLTSLNNELKAQVDLANEARKRMEERGFSNAEELKTLKTNYDVLNQRYDDLQKSYQSALNGSSSETRNLMNKLDAARNDLYKREDELNQLQDKLNKDREQLVGLRTELEKNNARLIDLERTLNEKDSQAEALRQKLSAALTGFENQGLTITKKNGKVYVSLEEKLLFPSGSTAVDPRGQSALRKLAQVLEQNKDINIMIEGHTDDVPLKPGSAYRDNWDLSVQRATSIIRILLEGTSIDPKRLTASGRGEHFPVDARKTTEARQKNRRTEIILEPKLDEVFQLLEK